MTPVWTSQASLARMLTEPAGSGDEDIDALAYQRIGHRVEVPIDRDMIVKVDGRPDRPVADHVRLDR